MDGYLGIALLIDRREERDLLEQMQHALHSIESCPEVEFSTEELLQDPLISMLIKGQQEKLEPPPPSTGTSVSSLLDLETSRLLLRLHPDRSVRRQVYELAVLTRGEVAITGLEHLSDVRRLVLEYHSSREEKRLKLSVFNMTFTFAFVMQAHGPLS